MPAAPRFTPPVSHSAPHPAPAAPPDPAPLPESPAAAADPDDRRSRKRRQTADHLVRTAFALFAEHGYEQVTMEQIAAAADVAKGTLYNHFPVKEALVRARMHAELAEALPRLFAGLPPELDCAGRLRAFLRATAAYSEQARDYLPHYIAYRLSQPLAARGAENRSGLDRVYARLLADGQARGEISGDFPADLLADTLQFMHLSTLLRWLETPGLALADAFDTMLDLFLHGCAAGDGR